MMRWAEHTDFGEPLQVQTLVNIFGAKKNYLAKTAQVNFDKLIEFLLNGPLGETVAHSQKLKGQFTWQKHGGYC